jgi:DNA-binding transcriptional regulator YiaG
MEDTATEMVAEMVDMVDDREKTIHGREATKAMGTTRILASCEDIRRSRTAFSLSCGGFSRVFSLSSLHHQG